MSTNLSFQKYIIDKWLVAGLAESCIVFCGDVSAEAEDQEGVMDNLLEALKNGSAFNVNRERNQGRKRTPRAAGG